MAALRLYYTDSTLRTFTARVLASDPQGDRVELVLDRTAFYPTSGGQPFDVGTLGGERVIEVHDREDGEIVHVVERPLPVGATVAGEVDWARRFDHMQQHTGQHLLSAAFDRLFGVRTVSFHLGAETSTIDLAREATAAEIAKSEQLTNEVIWDDRPVTVSFVDAHAAAALPLRKETARTGELRLVEIPDFDMSACGGTHVRTTGMVGLVAVTGTERFKGGTRVSFVCGGRALRSHSRLRDIVAASVKLLATAASDLPTGIERLQSEVKTASKKLQQLDEELSGHRALALRQSAEIIDGIRFVASSQSTSDASTLKRLAAAVVSEPGCVAIVTGAGTPTPVVMARSGNVAWDASTALKQAAERFGGRGGGRAEMAQGGLTAASEAIVTFARQSFAMTRSVNAQDELQ
jgi:alanyl-tRNA synthetase